MPKFNQRYRYLLDSFPDRRIGTIFLKYGVMVIGLSMMMIFWLFYLYGLGQLKSTAKQQDIITNYMVRSAEKEISTVVKDVHTLKLSDHVLDFLVAPNPENQRLAELTLLNYAINRDKYDQLRLLDTKGQELIRINAGEDAYYLVEQNKLQDKSDRYYFKEIVALKPDEVYISQFDLNIEEGAIEVPYKPMIRLGAQILDHKQTPIGIIIVNYLGDELINQMIEEASIVPSLEVTLINSAGYYLHTPKNHNEWSFMFGRSNTLRQDNPALYKALKDHTSGRFEDDSIGIAYRLVNLNQYTNYPSESAQPMDWYVYTSLATRPLNYVNGWHAGIVTLFVLIIELTGLLWLARRKFIAIQVEALMKLMFYGVEKSPAMFILTDIMGSILFVNERFEEVTGFKISDVIGKSPSILKSGKTQEEEYRNMWATISRGEDWTGEFLNRKKEGELYWAQARITCIKDKKDKISHYLAIEEDITNRKALEKDLLDLAHMDGLTNIYNKRYLNQYIDMIEEDLETSLCVMMIDLDHFKEVNDTYGHDAGDMVLKELTIIFRSMLREHDLQFRYGGEEFVIILPETDIEACLFVAERIRKCVEAYTFVIGTRDIRITISIGCATSKTTDKMEALVKKADEALYKAKDLGRNRVEYLK